ncbi:MAG: pinensin family lanthipeptide [Bacteroidota bacterium]
MKKKLSLNELKIESFITSVGEKDKVKSGLDTIFHICALSGELCNETDNPLFCPPTMEPPNITAICTKKTKLFMECGPNIWTEGNCL